jgi:hypothetical protein
LWGRLWGRSRCTRAPWRALQRGEARRARAVPTTARIVPTPARTRHLGKRQRGGLWNEARPVGTRPVGNEARPVGNEARPVGTRPVGNEARPSRLPSCASTSSSRQRLSGAVRPTPPPLSPLPGTASARIQTATWSSPGTASARSPAAELTTTISTGEIEPISTGEIEPISAGEIELISAGEIEPPPLHPLPPPPPPPPPPPARVGFVTTARAEACRRGTTSRMGFVTTSRMDFVTTSRDPRLDGVRHRDPRLDGVRQPCSRAPILPNMGRMAPSMTLPNMGRMASSRAVVPLVVTRCSIRHRPLRPYRTSPLLSTLAPPATAAAAAAAAA